ncbi:MAG: hypothetical protein A2Y10_08360 [Planctomycetes bacterium GWF2_41_51]|nr:MAG: hypothetical protein A2Y10_08360 [Planctomycetes bacterium GWF2_41_51]HBG25837.1 hypothetical protein [Phycisphaerales bacterium]
MAKQKKALEFASKLQQLLREKDCSQKSLHDKTGLSLTTVNRIVKGGYGDIDHVAKILNALDLPHNFKFNLLVHKVADIAEGPAKEILKYGLHLYRSPKEYLTDFCPIPLERAYAAALHGISYKDILILAEECGLKSHLSSSFKAWDIISFGEKFRNKFGPEAFNTILARQVPQDFPPVLQMDFIKVDPASKYIEVINGEGKIIFDVPHIVLAHYNFRKSGKIAAHEHKGGIEFVYSLEGAFRLIYENKPYPKLMTADGPIFIYDATHQHSIKLENGNAGRLIIVRFYPDRKKLRGSINNNIKL